MLFSAVDWPLGVSALHTLCKTIDLGLFAKFAKPNSFVTGAVFLRVQLLPMRNVEEVSHQNSSMAFGLTKKIQ